MKFIDIYNRILPFWGTEINFHDANLLGKNGMQSIQLSKKWDEVENKLSEDDKFGNLMVWTMFQIFHKIAIKKIKQNIFTLNPLEVDKTIIEKKYFKNLSNESWEKELAEYERTLQ
ncbi:hypothetical protein [Chryseobacterium sp. MFBS3-17]|uniref:hypothetical protein n=1 Tax=Chryseobacterium sp. MFBS3-17 TaxID=2886689 RepID=UPI001D0DD99E|nr:hypothetical protein [Chryseobacterium sp. MFBS3-17]MCC2589631.1 hypothetical protein [Chryseobacterium sp. MFBS3-17]